MLTHKENEIKGLVGKFLQGDDRVFDEIIRLVSQDIMDITVRYLRDREEAKDVTQEIFIRLYRSLGSFRGTAKITTWMYRLAINCCIDALRKRKNVVSFDERMATMTNPYNTQVNEIEKRDMRAVLETAVNALPGRQKDVFILKHFQGLTIAEISEIIGCSQSSTKTHLYRAVQRLQDKLGGRL